MKLVTYNIRYGLGQDGRIDLARIAAAVAGADVIALQEVERCWRRSGDADQPAELAALLPEHYWVYGPAFDVDASRREADGRVINRRRQHGTMLLARWPILACRPHVFPKLATFDEFNMTMGAVEGVIDGPNGALKVTSLHLNSLGERERLLQLESLLAVQRRAAEEGGAWTGRDELHNGDDWSNGDAKPPLPSEAILMGDFNSQPGGAVYERLTGPQDEGLGRIAYADRYVDAWVAAGEAEAGAITWSPYPGAVPARPLRLDYCFLSPALASAVRRAWIDHACLASDHYPCWFELDF